jgi:hypothetical protein
MRRTRGANANFSNRVLCPGIPRRFYGWHDHGNPAAPGSDTRKDTGCRRAAHRSSEDFIELDQALSGIIMPIAACTRQRGCARGTSDPARRAVPPRQHAAWCRRPSWVVRLHEELAGVRGDTSSLNGKTHPGKRWPSFSRFVARYRSLCSLTGGRIGTWSITSKSNPP